MKKQKTPKQILEHLIKNREENILLLSKRSDEDLKDLSHICYERQESAYDENNFEVYKIMSEKLSQIHAAEELKFSYTEEASDWIHW